MPEQQQIREVDPADVEPTKYNIAMSILDQDADPGDGMTVSYEDYAEDMSLAQFANFMQGVANVTKMLMILNVYRPELFDKVNATVEVMDIGTTEPSDAPTGSGPDPSEAPTSAAPQPATSAAQSW